MLKFGSIFFQLELYIKWSRYLISPFPGSVGKKYFKPNLRFHLVHDGRPRHTLVMLELCSVKDIWAILIKAGHPKHKDTKSQMDAHAFIISAKRICLFSLRIVYVRCKHKRTLYSFKRSRDSVNRFAENTESQTKNINTHLLFHFKMRLSSHNAYTQNIGCHFDSVKGKQKRLCLWSHIVPTTVNMKCEKLWIQEFCSGFFCSY